MKGIVQVRVVAVLVTVRAIYNFYMEAAELQVSYSFIHTDQRAVQLQCLVVNIIITGSESDHSF